MMDGMKTRRGFLSGAVGVAIAVSCEPAIPPSSATTEPWIIQVDGKPVDIVHIEATISELKPKRGKDGSLWRTKKASGLIAYDAHGGAYWSDGAAEKHVESIEWERV